MHSLRASDDDNECSCCFSNGRTTDRLTDGRTDGRTDGKNRTKLMRKFHPGEEKLTPRIHIHIHSLTHARRVTELALSMHLTKARRGENLRTFL